MTLAACGGVSGEADVAAAPAAVTQPSSAAPTTTDPVESSPSSVPTVPTAATAQPLTAAVPSVVTRTQVVTRSIAFTTVRREDPDLDEGVTKVLRRGRTGRLVLTYRVTYTDGEATGRTLLERRTVRRALDKLVAVGTRTAPADNGCDPNYSGRCVPIASDVDCSGGSGNGPEYVDGPVTVVGEDIYGLDRDGDGLGCE